MKHCALCGESVPNWDYDYHMSQCETDANAQQTIEDDSYRDTHEDSE